MYTEMFTLPETTQITPLAYEEGNGVVWVLCEFEYDHQVFQGYTGLKRMEIQGELPWADNWGSCCFVLQDAVVYAAPDPSSAVRGFLPEDAYVAKLQGIDDCGEPDDTAIADDNYLYFDHNYAFVEYYDTVTGMVSRGWVLASTIAATGTGAGRIRENCTLYDTDCSTVTGYIDKNTIVDHQFGNLPGDPYNRIHYYNPNTGEHKDAYVETKYIEVY